MLKLFICECFSCFQFCRNKSLQNVYCSNNYCTVFLHVFRWFVERSKTKCFFSSYDGVNGVVVKVVRLSAQDIGISCTYSVVYIWKNFMCVTYRTHSIFLTPLLLTRYCTRTVYHKLLLRYIHICSSKILKKNGDHSFALKSSEQILCY